MSVERMHLGTTCTCGTITRMDYLTAFEQATLAALVPRPAGDLETDVVTAARAIRRRRQAERSQAAAMIRVLRRMGYTWRKIQDMTGIPWATARRWLEDMAPSVDDLDEVS